MLPGGSQETKKYYMKVDGYNIRRCYGRYTYK
jgi:hypothetical protein